MYFKIFIVIARRARAPDAAIFNVPAQHPETKHGGTNRKILKILIRRRPALQSRKQKRTLTQRINVRFSCGDLYFVPVEPKPPVPRAVSESVSVSRNSAAR